MSRAAIAMLEPCILERLPRAQRRLDPRHRCGSLAIDLPEKSDCHGNGDQSKAHHDPFENIHAHPFNCRPEREGGERESMEIERAVVASHLAPFAPFGVSGLEVVIIERVCLRLEVREILGELRDSNRANRALAVTEID